MLDRSNCSVIYVYICFRRKKKDIHFNIEINFARQKDDKNKHESIQVSNREK